MNDPAVNHDVEWTARRILPVAQEKANENGRATAVSFSPRRRLFAVMRPSLPTFAAREAYNWAKEKQIWSA
jgi:hypothetical protein